MRRLKLFTLLILAGSIVSAQNLVPNSSFETNSSIPTGPGQYIRATSWNNVNLWPAFQYPYASPDYLHIFGTGGSQLPNSVFGFCTPFNGNAVMSAISWHNGINNFREYFACQLTSPMITGQPYDVVLHVRTTASGYGGWGSNGIQVAFSTAPLFQATHEPIVATPQISVGSIFFNTTWQTLTYSITPTQPFLHMTVGNFQTDANTLRSFSGSGGGASYFFYDAISVTAGVVLDQGKVELSGSTQGSRNVLEWSQEEASPTIQSNGFEVFGSDDGIQFRQLDKLSKDALMSYVDETPPYGMSWYKVRRNNSDGSTTWSNAVALENNGHSALKFISLYPNPIAVGTGGDQVFVQLEHPPVDQIETELYDMAGRLLFDRNFSVEGQRLSTLHFPVDELPAGMYSLKIKAGNEHANKSFVVRR